MKNNKISDYEIKEVKRFISDIYDLYGGNLDQEDWEGEALVTYLELWKRCNGKIYLYYDWGQIYVKLKEVIIQLKRVRNEKIRIESNLSLNASYGENGQMAESWFPGKTGNFVNRIVLWDYMKRLGHKKFQVLKLMYQREDDHEIMEKMHLSVRQFYEIKMELQIDFQQYLELR